MRVQVNGDVKDIPEALTLDALVDFLQLPQDRLAVERNREVVRRPDWAATILSDGDQLEIIHFVGGGSKD